MIFAAVSLLALTHIAVNGPIYQQISLGASLVSDYVPPSESLLPAALICNFMGDSSDMTEIGRYLDQLRTARKEFDRKYGEYMHRVPEGKLKDMMRGAAYQAAEQYFQVAEQDYVPLLLKGDREKAKNVLLSRMRPLYDIHAAAVDQIVAVATEEAQAGEVLAARNVRQYTSIMAGVGLVILLVGGLLSFSLARSISKQNEELQRSFDELRALAARLQSVREDERKRVAREIHDQLGQTLTAIKLDVKSLVRDLSENLGQTSARASSITKLVDETIQSVRRIATELRPGILDDLGLVATIEWAGEEFRTRTGMNCHLDLPNEDIPTDAETSTAIFRIFQETLTNIARHADANEVKARLRAEGGSLTLEVVDDGCGISKEALEKGRSLGILGMKERATMLGGDLTITGNPGKGTEVRVRIPQISHVA